MIGAATVLLLGAAAYGWSLAATDGDGDRGGPDRGSVPQPSVLAASGKCVVSYAVYSDAGDRFDATVTVANRDKTPIKNWNLWFIMQGDQTVSGGGKGSFKLEQQGKQVLVKSTTVLSSQKAVTMDISGRYAKSNAAPMVFQLGDQTCETYVSGKPGEPSRPVQRLSNGQVRLGPPTTTPKPGLSIGPGGVVVPVEVPSGTPTEPTRTDDPVPEPSETVPLCTREPENPVCLPPDPEDSPTIIESESEEPPPVETTEPTDPEDTGTEGGGGTQVLPAPPAGP
jgi:serine/threonine-protein kinase